MTHNLLHSLQKKPALLNPGPQTLASGTGRQYISVVEAPHHGTLLWQA